VPKLTLSEINMLVREFNSREKKKEKEYKKAKSKSKRR